MGLMNIAVITEGVRREQVILWILLLLAQETHHGMPTPVMEPPQSAPRVMRPDVREYRLPR